MLNAIHRGGRQASVRWLLWLAMLVSCASAAETRVQVTIESGPPGSATASRTISTVPVQRQVVQLGEGESLRFSEDRVRLVHDVQVGPFATGVTTREQVQPDQLEVRVLSIMADRVEVQVDRLRTRSTRADGQGWTESAVQTRQSLSYGEWQELVRSESIAGSMTPGATSGGARQYSTATTTQGQVVRVRIDRVP